MLKQMITVKAQRKKALALLIDPDKINTPIQLERWIDLIKHAQIDFVFVGGSLITNFSENDVIAHLKENISLPVVLFPGTWNQLHQEADAVLFLSLISGRNPELLIGQHVHAAPLIRNMGLEAIATGYMLVDCGSQTAASYVSQTMPLPFDKPEIAAATALAGEMLGLKCLYIDGGSGANRPVSAAMIQAVNAVTSVPIIVGGGIRNEEQLADAYDAGADIVVVGTAIEQAPELLFAFSDICAERNK